MSNSKRKTTAGQTKSKNAPTVMKKPRTTRNRTLYSQTIQIKRVVRNLPKIPDYQLEMMIWQLCQEVFKRLRRSCPEIT
jgi:hypothetical protein